MNSARFARQFSGAFFNNGASKIRLGANSKSSKSLQAVFSQLNKSTTMTHSRLLSAMCTERTIMKLASRNFPASVAICSAINTPPLIVAAGGAEVDSDESSNALDEDDTFTCEDEAIHGSIMGLILSCYTRVVEGEEG